MTSGGARGGSERAASRGAGPLAELLGLREHRALARAASRVAPLDGGLKVPHGHHVGREEWVELLEVVERQVGQRAAARLGELDGRARDVVRLAEGDALAHEVFGQVGREHEGRERRAPEHTQWAH